MTTLIFLDTNALMSDPRASGNVWRFVAHMKNRRDWNVSLITGDVAILECVARYTSSLLELRLNADRILKPENRLLPPGFRDSLLDQISDLASDYEQFLIGRLATVPVVTHPTPEVPHSVLVRRATSRQPPCNAKGDGYRDTLLWLTAIDAVKATRPDSVIFVSNDDAFKGDDPDTQLAETLTEEWRLETGGVPIRRADSLLQAVLSVLPEGQFTNGAADAEVATNTQGRQENIRILKELIKPLQEETICAFAVETALASLPVLDQRACALPPHAASYHLIDVGPDAVLVSRTDTVAEVQLDCTIAAPPAVTDAAAPEFSPTQVITKPLLFQIEMTLDEWSRPAGGEITSIRAMADDPGHRAWAATRRERAAWLRKMAELRAATQTPGFPSVHAQLYQALQEQGFTNAERNKWLMMSALAGIPPQFTQSLLPTVPFGGLLGSSDHVQRLFSQFSAGFFAIDALGAGDEDDGDATEPPEVDDPSEDV